MSEQNERCPNYRTMNKRPARSSDHLLRSRCQPEGIRRCISDKTTTAILNRLCLIETSLLIQVLLVIGKVNIGLVMSDVGLIHSNNYPLTGFMYYKT